MTTNVEQDTQNIIEQMNSILNDSSVPRNIKSSIENAKHQLQNKEQEIGLGISNAIYALDDISNDINMPSHTRTEIWSLISELERLNEQTKQK